MKKIYSSFTTFLLLFFIISNLVFSQLIRKTPYLIYNGNETEMQVIWQLYYTDTCRIDWGADTLYSLGSAQTIEYGIDHQHTYTITNLNPNAKYYYRVTTGYEVNTGNFRAAPDTSASAVSFFVYGDTRSNPGIHDQVAAAILKLNHDDSDFHSIIISSGDLVSDGENETYWTNEFFNPSYSNIQEMLATLPYQACMGNHEGSGVLFKKYYPYPFVNGRYWSFDYGPAHFIVVDQYTSYGPGSAQLTWIENDLESTTKAWKFIYLHEPGWTAGNHSNNTNVQNYIQPLCVKYGVPIVFGGHNHYYARAIVDNIQHITTGGGGAPLYQPDPGYPYIVTTAKSNHFCAVEINKNTLKFRAITSSGAIIDSFAIALTPVDFEIDNSLGLPNSYLLDNAYPNPFNPTTKIKYSIPAANSSLYGGVRGGLVTLKVYDILGQEVATLVNKEQKAGNYEVQFSVGSKQMASGIYFYRMQAGNFAETKKLILLK